MRRAAAHGDPCGPTSRTDTLGVFMSSVSPTVRRSGRACADPPCGSLRLYDSRRWLNVRPIGARASGARVSGRTAKPGAANGLAQAGGAAEKITPVGAHRGYSNGRTHWGEGGMGRVRLIGYIGRRLDGARVPRPGQAVAPINFR